MKYFAILLTGLFLTGAAAGDSEPFTDLSPNTWTSLGKVSYDFPAEYPGSFNMRFWCNMTWDPDQKRILFYEGYVGSHGQKYSIYANAMYSLKPAEKKVSLVNLSTHWKSGGGHYRYQATDHPVSWNQALDQADDWYKSEDAIRIADNLMLYQQNNGGWTKNVDMARVLTAHEKNRLLSEKENNKNTTIDNGATHSQMRFLARVYNATEEKRFKESFLLGLDYLL